MSTTVIPTVFIAENFTQAEEDSLAITLTGKRYGWALIFNTTIQVPRIWDGSQFINQPQIPPAIIPVAVVPINNQTANYNLVIADLSKLITCTKATAFVLGIPPNATVPFLLGATIQFLQGGAGQINFIPVAPAVLISNGSKTKTTGQYSIARLTQVAVDVWSLSGDIAV